MLMNLDTEYNYKPDFRGRGRTRAFGKRMLAVRAMAGETAWLDGRILWREGRLFWESQGRIFAPGPADLALVQRRLNQIQRYPVAGEQALGDLSAWLARRCARLEVAKRVYSVRDSDFGSVGQYLHGRGNASIERLGALLMAESLCANPLPISAARTLAAYGERAQPAVCALLGDESLPGTARALAALTLGAAHKEMVHGGGVARCTPPAAVQTTGWMQRAYSWGLRAGIPDDPVLYARLLSDPDGASLARRYSVAVEIGAPFQLDTSMLQDLLATGMSPKKVVSLAESLLALVPLSKLVLDYRPYLPTMPDRKRREIAEHLKAERRALLDSLAETLHAYLRATPDQGVVEAVCQLAYMVLELGESVQASLSHLVAVLREGLSLPVPAALQLPYLELLIAHREQMWDISCREANRKNRKLHDWLLHCQTEHVRPLLSLLDATKNAEIVGEAAQLSIYNLLSRYRWQQLERYRCMLSLARDLELREDSYLAGRLCDVVGNFTDIPSAHLALQALIRPLMRLSTDQRRHLSGVLVYAIPYSRQGQRQALSKVLPFFARLVDFAAEDADRTPLLSGLIQCIMELPDPATGEEEGQREPRLEWMLTYLTHRAENLEQGYEGLPWLLPPATVASVLAGGDSAQFQTAFRSAAEHNLEYDWERLEQGLRTLNRVSHLRAVLARIFSKQPHRCVKLIEQLGLLPRLGREASDALTSLEPHAPQGGRLTLADEVGVLPGEWQYLISLVPQLLPGVSAYLRAQQVLGGHDRLPPGLRRILEQPTKWAGELTYLQGLIERHPERTDLAIREANLLARLADGEVVLHSLRGELVETMQQMVAEAELAAVEHRVKLCYHHYLESVTGMAPLEVELNEDVLNAALLMTDVKSNRRLLLKLLKAYLGGERRWPEQHPINIEYLEKLGARGLDVRSWLRTHSRVYGCKGVAGGRVHIRLERDPLSILQMGNYFGTCLGFGGINAFSTVANACELNKRVIYARDGKGTVIGRKLLGISDEGKLVGFRTYCAVEDEAGGKELRALFYRYAAEFARRCGLELADEGTVPRLFAQNWYDDGVVAWPDDEQAVGSEHTTPKENELIMLASKVDRARPSVMAVARVLPRSSV